MVIAFSLICSFFFQPADSFTICRGKSILIKNGNEGLPAKSIRLSASDTASLVIDYHPSPSNVKWKRDMLLYEKDTLLQRFSFEQESGRFRIPAKDLNRWLKSRKSFTLVTEQHPASDDIMIRSKTVTLAILQLK